MIALLTILALGALQEPQAQVGEIVKGFDADDLRQVSRTVERLVESGAPALAPLEAWARAATPRGRDFAAYVADEIRIRGVLKDSYFPVKRVNFKTSEMEFPQVLEEFKSVTGVGFETPYGARSRQWQCPPLSLDLRDVSVMEAVDQLAQAATAGIQMQQGTLQLHPTGAQEPSRSVLGHYLFRHWGFHGLRTIRFRKPSERRLQMYLGLAWDPRLQPVRLIGMPRVTEAVDDQGADLRVDPPDGAEAEDAEAQERVAEPGMAGSTLLSLQWPSPKAERVRLLRGIVTLGFAVRKTVLTFEAPKDGDRREEGGTEVRLVSVGNSDGAREIELEIKSAGALKDAPIVLEATIKGGKRLWVFNQTRSAGDPLRVWFSVGNRSVAETSGLEKLQVSVVTEMAGVRVPFEFRDLGLK